MAVVRTNVEESRIEGVTCRSMKPAGGVWSAVADSMARVDVDLTVASCQVIIPCRKNTVILMPHAKNSSV